MVLLQAKCKTLFIVKLVLLDWFACFERHNEKNVLKGFDMINDTVQAIILAAGKSTRFNNGTSKEIAPICGKEMIVHTTSLLEKMGIQTTLVVGYKKELIEAAVKKHHQKTEFNFVEQKEQLGTGHAVYCTKHVWNKDHILVLNGDAPLLTQELVQSLIDQHTSSHAAMSLVVASNVDPSVRGYGHIIHDGKTVKIVEDRHLEHEPTEACTLNAGIYLFDRSFLAHYIEKLPRNEKSGEIYLVTLLEMASADGLGIELVDASFDEVRGVNTLKELWIAEQIKRAQLIEYWMINGVRFMLPQSVHIDESVTIGRGSCIGAGVQLLGNTRIGEHCTIGAFSVLNNATINNQCTLDPHVVIKNGTLKDHETVASFTHIGEQEESTNKQPIKKKEKTFVAAFKTAADQSFIEGA